MATSLTTSLLASRRAAGVLSQLTTQQKNSLLRDLAQALLRNEKKILLANASDFSHLPKNYAHADRLRLTSARIRSLAEGVLAVRRLPDPVGQELDHVRRPNGLQIRRVTTPIGVIGIIYEARPNVTIDVVSLTLKSGNAVVLKGGRDAAESNDVLVGVVHQVLQRHGLPKSAVTLLDARRPALTRQLMRASGYVDVLIPRGSQRLIDFVRKNSRVPTIETGAGVCHTYVEKTAYLDWATRMIVNAKTRRPSVCNALDTLLVDKAIAKKLLSNVAPQLAKHEVVLFADPESYRLLRTLYPVRLLKHARPSDYGREFLSLKAAIKVVPDWRAGLAHIQQYTSGHSEGIITNNTKIARAFTDGIDAAAVYVNAPTSFTDGYEFGLGAELGISTQKLHARGPMALRELTSYKWIVVGRGQIRPV
jgi:glutamate-5-semialdehyde dehydrogenase